MPSKAKSRTWAEQFADLDDPAPREFDPEELEPSSSSSEDEAASADGVSEAFDGREHYIAVEKSKLRKPTEITLGPQYEGSRVSRKALLVENDSDDPFGSDQSEQGGVDEMDVEGVEDEPGAKDSDEETDTYQVSSDSEGAHISTIERRSGPVKVSRRTIDKGTTTNNNGGEYSNSSSDPESERESDLDDEFSGDGSIDGEEEGEEDDMGNSHDEAMSGEHNDAFRRKELREMMAQEQKSVVASISQAVKSDASKGRAVEAQRSTFDALLNTRIRLQKGLISANSLSEHNPQENVDSVQNIEAVRAAEDAAVRLWNVLDGLRDDITKAHANNTSKLGSKRKRERNIASLEDMWSAMQAHESHFLQTRRATLEKWSARVRGPATLPPGRKPNNTTPQTITDILQEQFSSQDRLIKRTRIPRSCAPIQAQKKIPEDQEIFDDADFYQVLLKELVDRRMIESANGQTIAVQWTAVRDAKTKKNVDTRASKGRRLRYTVHEKLQNFMAPQDMGTWEQRQIDELFSSLLGQRARLHEDVGSADDEDCFGEEDLKLFRSAT